MGIRVSLIYRPINKGDIQFPITPRQTSTIIEMFDVVRDNDSGRKIDGVEVTVESSAQQRIQELAERICATHNLTDFECIHRLGYVPSGEALSCVRTAAIERHEAMHAADDFAHELRQLGVIRRDPK
jgi:molybdopterin synthase catalytic subunit